MKLAKRARQAEIQEKDNETKRKQERKMYSDNERVHSPGVRYNQKKDKSPAQKTPLTPVHSIYIGYQPAWFADQLSQFTPDKRIQEYVGVQKRYYRRREEAK